MMVLSKRNYNSCKFISLAKKNSSIFSVSYLENHVIRANS